MPYKAATNPQGNYNSPGGGSGSGNTGGGGGGGNNNNGGNSGPMGIGGWLAGDDVYQQGLAGLKQNFQMFRNNNRRDRRNLKTDYASARERLGQSQGDDLRNMQEDFAARGLFGSGVYQKDLNDFNLDYQNQFNDAETSLGRNIAQLLSDMQGGRRDYKQNRELLRSEAVRRRAAQYGITG